MTKKKLLIHIGHDKTGTTTIQKTFKASRVALEQQGVSYLFDNPLVGRDLLAHPDFLDSQNGNQSNSSEMDEIVKNSTLAWKDICHRIHESKAEQILVSSEYLFKALSEEGIGKLNQMIKGVARQTEIIAYIRDPSSYVLSQLQQNLRRVRNLTPLSRTRIKDVVDPISQHLEGEISLNIFARRSMLNGDVLTDFLSKYLPTVDPTSLAVPQTDANTSMSAEAMAVLLDLRSGRLDGALNNSQMIEQVRKADRRISNPTKPILNADASQSFINWAGPDLTWLREEKGIMFPDVDYSSINPADIDKKFIALERLEDVCAVDNDRKMRIFERAKFRMSLPPTVRRWFAKI